ncbi:bifunctional diguanylate cyclase/phosphodiesterase [Shewanella avicenniae]|uniref:Bifunctional diguanylate cyclase/phosphodiesterase n=1 Tax=Shewanella avicenniae TaxID=2814294 RepID=A0ABX7QMW8_9GAMM|nr:bifunctional diguanylate cyclase/phosphodiesterase [Shewanella avicenniae]QSX32321.1 bifunctional diguanylate cyclase/phosphodiesterase [Shewanella avicenniae]
MERAMLSALKVATIYAAFATLWILFSDMAVQVMVESPHLRTLAQTYKGIAFVIITALMLLGLVFRSNRVIEKANDMDHLTSLHSMSMFIRTLSLNIQQLKPNEQLVLGYLDIDDFKTINETLGYEKADIFLQHFAHDLAAVSLPGACLSRLHADQFASFIKYDHSFDIGDHAQHLQRVFNHCAKQHGLDSTCSIGVALYPMDGSNVKELMSSAQGALNVAKQKKDAIQFHDKSMTEKAMQRRELVAELRQAIAQDKLTVVYQPKYELGSLNVSGVEVLVRWNHPTRGYISPDVFIPLAEDHGLTNAISKLVVDKATTELSHANLLGQPLQHIAINVSAAEFNNPEEMASLTDFIINGHQQLAPFARIEITETATLIDMGNSMDIIAKLQASGITFSIDDFGTGYTSLAMLKDLTVDEIKIDRSFVAELERDPRSRTIVSAIIAMAKSFDIHVVAEGVETEHQLTILQQLGCHQAQGFFLARPMPIEDLQHHLVQANTITAP